ncbi:MAG: hypothetical protein M5U08_06830 [Burkholderiales bacterium]|nr:hypothetical protein [Burkholderiales bacterium]
MRPQPTAPPQVHLAGERGDERAHRGERRRVAAGHDVLERGRGAFAERERELPHRRAPVARAHGAARAVAAGGGAESGARMFL